MGLERVLKGIGSLGSKILFDELCKSNFSREEIYQWIEDFIKRTTSF